MATPSYEARLAMAIEAIRGPSQLSASAASKIYNVTRSTLQNRINGRRARLDSPANCKLLTPLEEDSIVQYILELTTRSFPPRLCAVEDMANQLLHARGAVSVASAASAASVSVGKHWVERFVKRRPELQMQ